MTEACSTDPLCEAVNQAVQAGIVVVVSAGNAGETPDGRTVLGGISSPGNSPYAITVGALNTRGTVDRSDDTVAAFSSRGPSAYDLGLSGPLTALAPNPLLWGEVASWTSANQIIWGGTIYNTRGDQIIWGGSTFNAQGEQIIWGGSVLTSPDAR